ncbi:MAG TPA: universal stress protein [Pyrinomonadaceae bacterium]|nr:universal stress protein [Pyrinomonadaceae bacterium]
MKILIGYDGSDCAEAALDDLSRAGLPPYAHAMIVSVTELWLPPPPPSSYQVIEEAQQVNVPADLKSVYEVDSVMVEEALELASKAGERLKAKFPGWAVKREAFYGSPAQELILKAEKWGADLIVVGSHGRSALGRLLLGSVSQKVLTEAHASVRVARGRIEVEPSPVRILLGVDGSTEAELAVREVASRVWPPGSQARVVIVGDPLTPTIVGRLIPPVRRVVEESNREETEWAEAVLEKATQVLKGAELEVTSAIIEGNPKHVLVEEAERWGADVIFLGSTGMGRVGRFLLGSVSAAVAARAACSVEVIRAQRDDPQKP